MNLTQSDKSNSMKSIISKAFLAVAALFSVTSCTEDMEYTDSKVTPVNALYEPADEKAVELQASATASLFFEWESAKAEDSGAPLYEVVFDLPGGDFSNPIYKVLSDGSGVRNYATISHKTLNTIGAKAGLGGGETGSIIWAVMPSRGMNTAPVKVKRTLTITRLLGFNEVPSQIFLTGEATEGGSDLSKAVECLSPETDVFQVYTSLKAGKGWKIVSDRSGAGMTFHVDGSKILEGDGECIAEEDGVYRITLDFSIASVTMKKISKVEFYFSPEGKTLFELPYVGGGVFKGEGTVNFKQESWGRDQRYKMLMTYGDGSEAMWGAASNIDSAPGAAGPDDSYFFAYETKVSQWDDKWKLNDEFDGKPISVALHFDAAQPYHSVEHTGGTTPDPDPVLTAPASLFIAGEATEGGNIECTMLSDNVFEIFTRLQAGKDFTLADADGNQFRLDGQELKPGNGAFTVEADGVYRLTVDFAAATFAADAVTRMSVFDCWHDHGSAVLDLDYAGNGEWEGTGVAFDSSKNTDDRYKFVMEVGGKTQQYGAVGGNREKAPSEAGMDADYFHLRAVNASQWDDSFKFEKSQLDKKLKIRVILHGTYTHSVSE